MGGLASRFGGEGEKGKEMGEGGKSVKRATKEAAKKAEKKTATKKKEMATKKSTKSFGCAFPWSYRKGGGARKAAKNWSDNTSSNQQMTDPSKRTSNERNNIEFFGEEDADHQNDELDSIFEPRPGGRCFVHRVPTLRFSPAAAEEEDEGTGPTPTTSSQQSCSSESETAPSVTSSSFFSSSNNKSTGEPLAAAAETTLIITTKEEAAGSSGISSTFDDDDNGGEIKEEAVQEGKDRPIRRMPTPLRNFNAITPGQETRLFDPSSFRPKATKSVRHYLWRKKRESAKLQQKQPQK